MAGGEVTCSGGFAAAGGCAAGDAGFCWGCAGAAAGGFAGATAGGFTGAAPGFGSGSAAWANTKPDRLVAAIVSIAELFVSIPA